MGRPKSRPIEGPAHPDAARQMCEDAVAVARQAMDREAAMRVELARVRAVNAALLVELVAVGGLAAASGLRCA